MLVFCSHQSRRSEYYSKVCKRGYHHVQCMLLLWLRRRFQSQTMRWCCDILTTCLPTQKSHLTWTIFRHNLGLDVKAAAYSDYCTHCLYISLYACMYIFHTSLAYMYVYDTKVTSRLFGLWRTLTVVSSGAPNEGYLGSEPPTESHSFFESRCSYNVLFVCSLLTVS